MSSRSKAAKKGWRTRRGKSATRSSSKSRSLAAKKAWRTRRRKYGKSGSPASKTRSRSRSRKNERRRYSRTGEVMEYYRPRREEEYYRPKREEYYMPIADEYKKPKRRQPPSYSSQLDKPKNKDIVWFTEYLREFYDPSYSRHPVYPILPNITEDEVKSAVRFIKSLAGKADNKGHKLSRDYILETVRDYILYLRGKT